MAKKEVNIKMIGLRKEGNRFIIEFNEKDVSDEFLSKLLSKYRVEELVKKNEMTKEEAWKLSEKIKENWYNENEDWILEKMELDDNESDS